MKIPKARVLSNGKFFIQMRLGGESITISDWDRKKCERKAELLKAQYHNGLVEQRKDKKQQEQKTLGQLCDDFISDRENILSPSTIRGYKIIRKTRFKEQMEWPVQKASEANWTKICNSEAALCSPKTVKNALGFLRTVLSTQGIRIEAQTPQVPVNKHPFLDYQQILLFVDAVHGTQVEIPALLALHSLRRSEIFGLKWENIDFKKRIIQVKGSRVVNSENKLTSKKQNKNSASTRYIPIMIDELYDALERNKGNGKEYIVTCDPCTIYKRVNRLCEENDLPRVGVHGLRHSFASLAYHLDIPEKYTMELGGWKDDKTMKKIYTHISQTDVEKSQNAISYFFKNRNAGKGNPEI